MTSSTFEELKEQLADLEHQQWSHWEKYREERLKQINNPVGMNIQINSWNRLRETDYKDLTEKEKISDREWADKVLKIVEQKVLETIEKLSFEKVDGTELVNKKDLLKELGLGDDKNNEVDTNGTTN